ncbi:MAG: CHAT domain-containing protein [Pyrinomonadaceae bacterium]
MRIRIPNLIAAVITIALLATISIAATSTSIARCQSLGNLTGSAEHQLQPNQCFEYRVDLAEGTFVRFAAEQRGVDLKLEFFDVAGQPPIKVADSPNRNQGYEGFVFVVHKSGEYTLRVRWVEPNETYVSEGTYRLTIAEKRSAVPPDEEFIRSVNQADTLLNQGDAAGLTGAIAIYGTLRRHDRDWLTYRNALALSEYGRLLRVARDNEKAVNVFRQALALAGSSHLKGEVSSDLGLALYRLGNFPESESTLRQAIPLIAKFGNADDLAQAYTRLTITLTKTGKIDEAVDLSAQAEAIVGVPEYTKITVLNNHGLAYAAQGKRGEALRLMEGLPARYVALKKLDDAVLSLSAIVGIYESLNDIVRAKGYLDQLLQLADKTTKPEETRSMVFYYLGRFEADPNKKIDHFNRALTEQRSLNNPDFQGIIFNQLGIAHYGLGNRKNRAPYRTALEFYAKAQAIFERNLNKIDLAQTLNNAGAAHFALGEAALAVAAYRKALVIYNQTGFKNGEAETFHNLMMLYDQPRTRRIAILYGKRSVNSYQELRRNIQDLSPSLQLSYLKGNEDTYRRLADILVAAGRLVEAEQVLAMLKEKESFEYLRGDASEVERLSERADLTSDESAALKRYAEVMDQIAKIGNEYEGLNERLRKGQILSVEETATHLRLSVQLEDANRAFEVLLRQLAEEFSAKPSVVNELKENAGLRGDLRRWGPGVVFLHTLVGEDRYRVILTTAATQTDAKTEIKAAELSKKIAAFRQAIQNKTDVAALGKELYDILIKPIEPQLEGARAKTILWSLDGSLRLLPLPALWDGRQYFGEKYQNVVITLASRTRLDQRASAKWRAAGFGVTQATTIRDPNSNRAIGFVALPFVKDELTAVVHTGQAVNSFTGVLPGEVFLDHDFSADRFKTELTRGFGLIHIASHFSLNPGNATRSFLLLGDGNTLSVDEIKNSPRFRFDGVELLTLSACQTAVVESDGTGKEVEGFGYVAQRNGAQAILASLWKVNDESTSQLMANFYQIRETDGLTKAEALQRSQVRLLQSKTFSHPFYWSAFVIIGNWR